MADLKLKVWDKVPGNTNLELNDALSVCIHGMGAQSAQYYQCGDYVLGGGHGAHGGNDAHGSHFATDGNAIIPCIDNNVINFTFKVAESNAMAMYSTTIKCEDLAQLSQQGSNLVGKFIIDISSKTLQTCLEGGDLNGLTLSSFDSICSLNNNNAYYTLEADIIAANSTQFTGFGGQCEAKSNCTAMSSNSDNHGGGDDHHGMDTGSGDGHHSSASTVAASSIFSILAISGMVAIGDLL